MPGFLPGLLNKSTLKMIKRLGLVFGFIHEIGLVWFLNRIWFEVRKYFGFTIFYNHRIVQKSKDLRYVDYKLNNLICGNTKGKYNQSLKIVEKINKGFIQVFSGNYENYSNGGSLIDWHYQPLSGMTAPKNIEWNRIDDFGYFGDIKLIWEPSRFSFVVHYVRSFQTTKNEKYARECIELIIDWIDSNTYPYGGNYKCGQEISFRLFAWIIAIESFAEYIKESELQKILHNVYVSLLRIDSNIAFAVKSVKNNHSISEAAGLFIGGTLFPGFPESKKWQSKGIKLLVKETGYQILNDGSYIQHSMNYHRLAMDVISFVAYVSKKVSYKLPDVIFERHKKMYQFLASFVFPDGRVANYGPNDGAYLFPLSEYQDYRPSLNFAGAVNSGELLFAENTSIVDFFGIKAKIKVKPFIRRKIFNDGGYYQLFNKSYYCFVRCHNYKTRPSHSDALHLDIWVKGKNIFCDTGSFSYNTDKITKEHFTGIFGHNTININNEDYMKSVFNFGRTNWPDAKVIAVTDNEFHGANFGYRKIFGITHQRNLIINDKMIVIKDILEGINKATLISQQWHTEFPVYSENGRRFFVEDIEITSNIEGKIRPSKVSRYYNSYKNANLLVFCKETSTDLVIETRMTIKE